MTRTPGSPEWLAHVAACRVEEAARPEPEQWWWLSFGLPGKGNWLGGCMVKGRGFTTALDEATRLGINPGGECKGYPAGTNAGDVPVNRLLTKDSRDIELERM